MYWYMQQLVYLLSKEFVGQDKQLLEHSLQHNLKKIPYVSHLFLYIKIIFSGFLQGHWWGFISRNYVVWPTFLLLNVFTALKGSHFRFLFLLQQLQAVRSCLFDLLIYPTIYDAQPHGSRTIWMSRLAFQASRIFPLNKLILIPFGSRFRNTLGALSELLIHLM